jgi:heme a synthase
MSVASRFVHNPGDVSAWPHRLAVCLACATFPLLFIGGLVTSKGAGLAVPDWPTTFGYNMFLYPWSKMVGNVFYEHSHRLVAAAVGLLTIVLTLAFWLRERRYWLRRLGLAALLLVVLQGVIGGLRVVWLEQGLAIVHAAFAQAFFALTVSLGVFTSPEWREPPKGQPITDGGRLLCLCAATTGLIYVQAIFGAVLRHTGESLEWHLLFAALVTLHVLFILVRVLRAPADHPKFRRPACVLGILLLLQLMLGAGSYLGKFTSLLGLLSGNVVLMTTTHLAAGALMLATSLWLTLRAYRVSAPPRGAASRDLLTEQFSV